MFPATRAAQSASKEKVVMLLYATLETGSTTQLCALLRLHLVLLMDHALLKEIA
jgi:hypothetical protein